MKTKPVDFNAILQPGDALLFERVPFFISPIDWFVGLLICIKTWSRYCHIEIYEGSGYTMTSKRGWGVNIYKLNTSRLAKIRRPLSYGFRPSAGGTWFNTVIGQKYDWIGLLCFWLAASQGAKDKQHCGEVSTRYYRKSFVAPFSHETDADKVSPAQFDQSIAFWTVWKKPRT